jgi:predicted RNase H-like HicB family nuclease
MSSATPTEIIFVVEESPEGGYEARALGFSIFTQAESMEELKAMVQDAVRCHFEDGTGPRIIRLHIVKDEVIPA